MYYAQIDENNKCVGLHDMASNDLPNLILLETYQDVLGKIYIDGEWTEDETPAPEPSMTEAEQTTLEIATNIDYLVCMADFGI